MTIDDIWPRIVAHQGETFTQIRGKAFKYAIKGNAVRPDTTNWQIPRSQFEKALACWPFSNTVPLQSLQGPSYVFAILTDPRISG